MRSPLAVRISDGFRNQHVTRFVRGMQFTKTAPGGHHSASVSIEIPEGVLSDLGPADRLFIYDGRSSRTVWDGYIENPGRTNMVGGARYSLSAMGGVVLASDNARPVVFRSTDITGPQWRRHVGTHPDATIEMDDAVIPGAPALKLLFPPKSVLLADGPHGVDSANTALVATGQRLHSASVMVRGGRVDATYFSGLIAGGGSTDFAALTTSDVTLAATGGAAVGPLVILDFQLGSPASDADVAEDTWAAFRDFVLTPVLLTPQGGDATPSSVVTVLAHEVVGHVVASLLPMVDGVSAHVESTSFPMENLAYLEAAKPQQILDDLSLYEPDFLWEILESNPAGKHRFAYRVWPTTPRYEISGREFTESGGELDLCNRIVVSWKDSSGADRTTIRTTTVPALGARVRDAEPITLPEGQGSQANAERIGDEILASLNSPSHSGTAVVRRPIRDMLTGMTVMPWEIEPGYLVRVRDIGVDLRLTEMTYEDDNCTASLTLGSPTLNLAQRLARLR